MPLVHLNIGSNIGDRRHNITQGVDALRRLLAVSADPAAATTIAVSRYFESAPWGFDSPNRFLNIGLNLVTALLPLQLLNLTSAAEREVSAAPHRAADGTTYIDRAIDIDIIFYDTLRMEHPRLILPHPRAYARDFVIVPLLELNPDYPLDLLAPGDNNPA